MIGTANIPLGASARKSIEVVRDSTVAHFHSRMPEVYGTPMMICLMEEAARAAIQEYLPEGWVSVGTVINVKHLAATPVGFKVTARAEVVSVSDNMVTFAVEAHDGIEKIGEGLQVRAAIEVKRFEQRIRLKTKRALDRDL
jgi:fluoroacetyl-CoA thioesterase